jgi:hypothetical protein
MATGLYSFLEEVQGLGSRGHYIWLTWRTSLPVRGSTGIAYDPLGRLQQVTASSTTQYPHDGGMLVSPRYSNLSATRE